MPADAGETFSTRARALTWAAKVQELRHTWGRCWHACFEARGLWGPGVPVVPGLPQIPDLL
eukprot:15443977-Alexandrium_andersonii.AAC.1